METITTQKWYGTETRLDVTGYEIIKTGKWFRYVSHADRIATPGFPTERALIKYRENILATPASLQIYREKYADLFTFKQEPPK